jgi:hypothetical protein
MAELVADGKVLLEFEFPAVGEGFAIPTHHPARRTIKYFDFCSLPIELLTTIIIVVQV